MPDGIVPGTGALTSSLVRRFGEVIHTLTPGAELINIYWLGEQGPDGRYQNSEPTTDQVTVSLSYENMYGRKYTADSFHLDVDVIGLSTQSRRIRGRSVRGFGVRGRSRSERCGCDVLDAPTVVGDDG